VTPVLATILTVAIVLAVVWFLAFFLHLIDDDAPSAALSATMLVGLMLAIAIVGGGILTLVSWIWSGVEV